MQRVAPSRAFTASCAVLAAASALLVGGDARAQSQPPPPPPIVDHPAAFTWDNTSLRLSLSYRNVIDQKIRDALVSGIPTVIVMKAWVFEPGHNTPVADLMAARSCRVTYDTWDEVFKVELTQPGRSASSIVPNIEGVLRRCADVDRIPLVMRNELTVGATFLVQGIVEINPISPAVLAQIKRWVSRPSGGSTVGANNALFSSFVGLFVAQIGKADKEYRFRTQSFVVPPPPPPPSASGSHSASPAPPAPPAPPPSPPPKR